ncbi:TPR repeat protein [Sphingomonas naasensis]|uniref:Sel1 repeat family protein n=1 Tax=Sphingomonas naasensis TaxID=1344951 RepID=A0A4S1WMJ2_9SPHN|nr:SEL1-like repeat protein [Sphingomonas naasensis]NIJ20391.1 TPR repeat protein [Sphingomonas naasensis]TGX44499.1 hypothetical protein E5A74_06895 [Sphingomonas naasensis]
MLIPAAPALAAADTPWTAAQAERAARATATCTGSEYETRQRHAPEIVRSLPKPGETVLQLSDERATDIYTVAEALLKPAIPDPQRALDPTSFITCPRDPALGVELMMFLAADGPANRRGPNNIFYWLGQAYRHGADVTPDARRARHYFLVDRVLGNVLLTSEDWGDKPTDTLMAVLARPANRAMLESAANAGRSEAQLLLAELLLPTDKDRARKLLRGSAEQHNARASRRLSDLEAQGAFGGRHYEEAVRVRAWLAAPDNDDLRAMLDAARAFNGGEVPSIDRKLSIDDLGGARLRAEMQAVDRDSIVGRVPSRALVAPNGRILYTEVTDPDARDFSVGRNTLRVLRPENLDPLAPYFVNGRALFAWVTLPTINWR